jgi:hypothetical protein
VTIELQVSGRKLAEILLPDLSTLSGRGRLTADIQNLVRSEQ